MSCPAKKESGFASERTFLGLDLSTQTLKSCILNDNLEVLTKVYVSFESELPEFRTTGGAIVDNADNTNVTVPTIMWVKALDILMDKLTLEGVDFAKIAAVSGSAQTGEIFYSLYQAKNLDGIVPRTYSLEPIGCPLCIPPWQYLTHFVVVGSVVLQFVPTQHGTVYWHKGAEETLKNLSPGEFLHYQLNNSFSVTGSPIWMDSTTTKQCKQLEEAVGGPEKLAEITGSRAYERFSGPQIAKIFQTKPNAYRNTERISLISSFLCSIFLGKIAPIDLSDGSGMNLLDIRTKKWNKILLDACGPNLAEKLGEPVPSYADVGPISRYFKERYNFNSNCRVIAHTGDNPASLIGMRRNEGWIAVSLGTSDTVFLWLKEPKTVLDGNVLCNPLDENAYMAMLGSKNGSLTRERIKNKCANGSWDIFGQLLNSTPRGNSGNMGLYYDMQEFLPFLQGEYRFTEAGATCKFTSPEVEVRALVEGQLIAKRAYAEEFGIQVGLGTKILATGGASQNKYILQVLADVFNSPVYVFEDADSAMLGAGYQAKHGLVKSSMSYEDMISNLPQPELACEPYHDVYEIYTPMVERFRNIVKDLIKK